MDTQSVEDILEVEKDWMLLLSGGRAYIGCTSSSRDDVLQALSGSGLLVLEPAYEISVMNIPMQGPGGQVVVNKQIGAEPVLLSFEGSPFHLKPTGVCFFSGMKPGDRARYKGLVDQAEKLATAARADQAGLVLPGGKLPNAR
jgi:hypothetical protein